MLWLKKKRNNTFQNYKKCKPQKMLNWEQGGDSNETSWTLWAPAQDLNQSL